jgi:predicted nuclease of predicted toxin-antitoxin system
MVKVLFDHNLPPALARALNEVVSLEGHEARALRDLFEVDIADVDYFNQLGSRGSWIVISKDLKNSKKRAERAAILDNKILAFYLSASLQKKHITMQAAAILWHWPAILKTKEIIEKGLFRLPENKGKFHPM